MSFAMGLRANRAAIEDWLNEHGKHSTLSASRYGLHQELVFAIAEHARGSTIELGAGHSPLAGVLAEHVDEVVTLDIDRSRSDVDIVGDIQHMAEVESDRFETAVCTQVLEHVPRPWAAMDETRRVLRSGGTLLLSAPHLSMVHEAPHDYYRYTKYGLTSLLENAGFEVLSIAPTGGLLAFLAHYLSLGLWSMFGWIRALRWPVWTLNYALLVWPVHRLDRVLGMRGLFPTDHVVVARVRSLNDGVETA